MAGRPEVEPIESCRAGSGASAPEGERPSTQDELGELRGRFRSRRVEPAELILTRRRLPQRRRLAALVSLVFRGSFALALVYGALFNFSIVRGSSMSPSIFDGDRILIDHLSYLFNDVRRGDIVVLRYPLDPRLDYIKRVIGLPGDRIEIRSGRVWVNGEELLEDYVDVPDLASRVSTRVCEGSVFVLGDNRCHSSDSREFGQVPFENLRGKVDVRVWPLGRVGLIQ